VVAELADPAREQEIVDALVAGTDQVNDHGSSEYIPPGESLWVAVLDVARKKDFAESSRPAAKTEGTAAQEAATRAEN
jgi:hypothetical protein